MSKVLETQAWNCNEWPRALSDQVDKCMEVSDRADMSTEQVVAYAILAERARCAQILLTKHENHPQDGFNWDGTYYYLYEKILAGE